LLNPDYQDILSAFEEEGVRYLLVGAYALAVHGYVGATGDIDLWVETSEDNAARIIAALRRFGAPLHQIEERDFEVPGTVFQIGVAPRRIDILTSISSIPLSGLRVDASSTLHSRLRLQNRYDLLPISVEGLLHRVVHEVDVELIHAEILEHLELRDVVLDGA
jgi:hypothetical protein